MEESKLLKLEKVKETGQNIWKEVKESEFETEFKKYHESSKKLGYTTESIDNFKKIQTQPQYINIYEKKDGDDEENQKSMNKKFKYHYDAVDTFKKTSATYNNDRSSRSHLVYEIRVGVKKPGYEMKFHNIIICDLAGKEDVISDEKMKGYILNIYKDLFFLINQSLNALVYWYKQPLKYYLIYTIPKKFLHHQLFCY